MPAAAVAQFFAPITPAPAQPGAFGSLWTSELWVYNGGSQQAILTPRPAAAGTQVVVPPKTTVQLTNFDAVARDRGVVLDVSSPADLRFELQVREISRGGISAVSVPVVPLDAFSTASLQLLNVPVTSKARTTVRLYVRSTGDAASTLTVRVYDMDREGPPLQERLVTIAAVPTLPPTYVDSGIAIAVVPDILAGSELAHARIEIAGDGTQRVWAFATATDDTTQQVLVVTP